MPDLMATVNDLKGLPDEALQRELANPTGAIPGYLVLAEAQRRSTLRSAAQRSQKQSGTVYDDVIRSMMARQPPQGLPPAPPGMAPVPGGQPVPGATPPQNFRPPQQMAKGGAISDYGDYIDSLGQEFGVDPDMIRRIAMAESAGDPNAVSPKGARGFMQLMPDTADELGVDPRDPKQNLRGGTMYYARLLQKYRNPRVAAAAYNAGPGAVDRYNGIPPFKETIGYLGRVFKGYRGTGYAARVKQEAPVETAEAENTGTTDNTDGTDGTDTTPANATAPPPAAPPEAGPPPLQAQALPGALPQSFTPASTLTPPAAVPAPAPAPAEPSVADQYFASDQEKLRTEIARLREQYGKEAKPNFWQSLADFGWGMAASPSPFLATQIGAGGQAMMKGQREREEAWRKMQLEMLGVDVRLDDQARKHQEQIEKSQQKLAETKDKAVQQAQKTAQRAAEKNFEYLTRTPGAVLGSITKSPGSEYNFSAMPTDPSHGVWTLPEQLPVTQEVIPYLGTNPAIDQPSTTSDMLPTPQIMDARKDVRKVATQKKTTEQKATGTFEKDFLPGWAEDNEIPLDQITGSQRKAALAEFHSGQRDPNLVADAEEIGKGIMDGTQPPDLKGLYRYGGHIRAFLHKNNYDLLIAQRDWTNLQKYYATLNGPQQTRVRQATQLVSESLPVIDDLYEQWKKTELPKGYKLYNKAALVAATQMPGQAGNIAQQLMTQINNLTSEVGTMYKGGNSSTDESLRLAGENLKAEWNEETFAGAMKQLKIHVKIRQNSMSNLPPVGVNPASPYLPPQMKGGQAGETGGGAAVAPPPRPSSIPIDADAEYSPKTKKWRFRLKGSSEWQILKQ